MSSLPKKIQAAIARKRTYQEATVREQAEAIRRGFRRKTPYYIKMDQEKEQKEKFRCEQCGRPGPYHHFEWAHQVTRASNPNLMQINKLRRYSDRVFAFQVKFARFLCRLCHADETEEQRANNWGKAVPVKSKPMCEIDNGLITGISCSVLGLSSTSGGLSISTSSHA